ncbi:MAG: Zn-dependent exopeptidase M28 [Ignavibacteriales bacterium]|nr:Zn-dependent exopeptidase M28 [Ignavibacteriales bacterium]
MSLQRIIPLLMIVSLGGCEWASQPGPQSAENISHAISSISAAHVYKHIDALQMPAGLPSRIAFTPGFDSAVSYVRRAFSSIPNLTSVELDTFFVSTATPPLNAKALVNVVATLRGSTQPEKQVVVGAHLDCSASFVGTSVWNSTWSTIRAPGADDNASGVAGVLEIARVLSETSPELTLKFIAFGAEELVPAYNLGYSLLGSAVYVGRAVARGDQVVAMINLDMIAYNPQSLFCDIAADSTSTFIGQLAVDLNAAYNIGLTMRQQPFSPGRSSDHASFWDAKIPAVLFIENFPPRQATPYYPSNSYYHLPSDSLSHLNMDLARRITQLAGATALALAKPTRAK